MENIKSFIKINQIEKLNINKFWENNLAGFKGIIYLNSVARIIKKELLKNKNCENINIFKE